MITETMLAASGWASTAATESKDLQSSRRHFRATECTRTRTRTHSGRHVCPSLGTMKTLTRTCMHPRARTAYVDCLHSAGVCVCVGERMRGLCRLRVLSLSSAMSRVLLACLLFDSWARRSIGYHGMCWEDDLGGVFSVWKTEQGGLCVCVQDFAVREVRDRAMHPVVDVRVYFYLCDLLLFAAACDSGGQLFVCWCVGGLMFHS